MVISQSIHINVRKGLEVPKLFVLRSIVKLAEAFFTKEERLLRYLMNKTIDQYA